VSDDDRKGPRTFGVHGIGNSNVLFPHEPAFLPCRTAARIVGPALDIQLGGVELGPDGSRLHSPDRRV